MTTYFSQPKNEISAPLRDWDKLRASGNLTFPELIALISELWNKAQPDIPIVPTQGKNFAKYPSIVYGTEIRVPRQDSPKRRHREYVHSPDGTLYKISGQHFRHLISFTCTTQNEPELAEALIETFEDFMEEITGIMKLLGLAEFFYGRRLPDAEENRDAEDICKRTVVYEAYFEKVTQTPVDQFKEIVVNARQFLENIRNIFTGESGNDYIVVDSSHALDVNMEVIISSDEDNFLPLGLNNGWRYVVTAVDGNKIYLETLSGRPISLGSNGSGRLALWMRRPAVHIEDEFATPSD